VQLATDVVDGQLVYAPIPASGALGEVISTSSVRVRFDRFLLPESAIRQAICVQSDLREVKILDDCVAPIFFEPVYDPAQRRIIYRQSGTPDQAHFTPGTTYKLTVLSPVDDTAVGVRAFDGAPLEATVSFEFTTRAADPPATPSDAPQGDALFCGAVKDYLNGCSYGGGCHGVGVDENNEAIGAVMGLNLRDTEGLISTAILKVAHQTQTGESASDPVKTPLRFGRAMPLIDPGSPGTSYLLYKAIVSPLNNNDPATAASAEEIARLQASVVPGMPMPPTAAPGSAFGQKGLDEISAWIAAGAPIPACP